MKKIGLSVIIPVYNSAQWIGPTMQHIFDALSGVNFDAELIIVDDGSSDGSAKAAAAVKPPKGVRVDIVAQKNSGRYLARKVGVARSTKDNILFIDSRVYIDKDALSFLANELKGDPDQIWNGHVNIDKKGNIFARFWDAIVCVAWRKYFRKPRKTSYSIKEFDYYPKGTGFFYVPKKRLVAAMDDFEKVERDLRYSSDDTLLIRFMNERKPINLSPDFSCLYHGRSTFVSFLKHAYSRGQFFIDGFLKPGTRFFYPLLAVLLMSLGGIGLLLAQPLLALQVIAAGALLLLTGLFIGSILLGVAPKDAASLAILGGPFAVVYLMGLWRGVVRKFTVTEWLFERLVSYRPLLRGSLAEYLLVAAVYVFFVFMFTGGVLAHIDTQVFASPGDATAGFLWLNSTDQSLTPFINFYEETNFPHGEAASGFTLVSYLAYWMPMRVLALITSPLVALNLMMVAGYLFSALSMYLVVKRLTSSWAAAFLSGFAAVFAPYFLIKSVAHMSYIFGGIFTLVIGVFVAFWQGPTWKRATVLGLLLGVSLYFDGYFMLIAAVLGVSLVISAVVYNIIMHISLSEWLRLLRLSAISVGVAGLMTVPLLVVNALYGSEISSELASNRSDVRKEIVEYRSNVIDFILPQKGSILWSDNDTHASMLAYKDRRSNAGESTHYIAVLVYLVVVVGSALLAVRLFLKRYSSLRHIAGVHLRTVVLVVIVGGVAAVGAISIMFSPEIIVGGIRIPLPGALLVEYDISFWRVMSRLFVLFNIAIVLLFGVSLWLFMESIKSSAKRPALTGGLVICIIFACIAAEYATVLPGRPYDFTSAPKTYSWLSHQQNIGSVAMLPLVDPIDVRTSDYMTAQIIHKKPLLNQKVPGSARLNNALGSDTISIETLNLIRDRKIDAVVLYDDSKLCNFPELGNAVYKEALSRYSMTKKTAIDSMLCTIKVEKGREFDPVYVVYGNGFSPSANAGDQSDIAFRPGGRGDLLFTTNDFASRFEGRVAIKALLRMMPDVKNATWRVVQDGETIAEGSVASASPAIVEAIAIGSKPATVVVDTPGYEMQLGDAYLEEVVVSAL